MPYFIAILLITAWAAEPPPKQIVIREKAVTQTDTDDKNAVKPDTLTENETSAVSAVVSAIARTIMTPAEAASTVRGSCTYRGGFCPGALVELKNIKGQVLGSQILASIDGFTFSNLKPGRYNLEASYPRYNLRTVRKEVSPGSEIIVEMTE